MTLTVVNKNGQIKKRKYTIYHMYTMFSLFLMLNKTTAFCFFSITTLGHCGDQTQIYRATFL